MPLRRREIVSSESSETSFRRRLGNLFSRARNTGDSTPSLNFPPNSQDGRTGRLGYAGDSQLPLPAGHRPEYPSRAQSPSGYGINHQYLDQRPLRPSSAYPVPWPAQRFYSRTPTPPPAYESRHLLPLRIDNIRSRSPSTDRLPWTAGAPAHIVNREDAVFSSARDGSYEPDSPDLPADPRTELVYYISDATDSSESFVLPTTASPSGRVEAEEDADPAVLEGERSHQALQNMLGVSSDADITSNTNLNRKYDYLSGARVPVWYKKYPIPATQGARFLCGTCRHIDFLALFRQEETDVMPKSSDYVLLGTLESLISRLDCGFCRLVTKVIYADIGSTLPLNMDAAERISKKTDKLVELMSEPFYLCPIRFKSTFREPILYVFSGQDVAEAATQKSARRPRGSMAIKPVHNSFPNLGRLLKNPTQIDFEWIRERIRLCDERDVGRLNYRHGVNVRAIDVQTLRLVDLADNVRYVTLSYTWGSPEAVDRLLLNGKNESSFREGGLSTVWARVPKTIQDAITLVRNIGERYIWIDALCIIQDDDQDRVRQIAEMGEIYGNSILTLCVCCGKDASSGIPGIEVGTRDTHQVAEIVGDIVMGNSVLDQRYGDECVWDTRGWTLQEKVLSQRKIQIYDICVRWWCWHTITAEDENCRHTGWKPGTRYNWMYFFKDEHDLVVSKIGQNSNMDIYAFIVSDYTSRNLTYQADAESAVMGALDAFKNLFRGEFISGLPDTNLVAALLWILLKSSERRIDATKGKALFPS